MSALLGRVGAGRGGAWSGGRHEETVITRRQDTWSRARADTWHATGGWDWAEVTPRHTAPASSHTPGPPPSS